ncbi:SH3 domain-containing protein [Granulicella tundricola]|uniref:Putative lipoprotein n=1 Tax=Granulicella tundricola (strain ATCC BAA-1859 / DSM 23138 / MP5ACTX9) TaxID=1198114 RepID=E8X3L0_GRATM|nr:SH3 domain-containing protein [Granulicella tundricola]ADW68201.1 putative lipoprotein [Granulicella tundricola MP5ACTX9]
MSFGLAGGLLLAGCSRFHEKPNEHYVFVTSKQGYLRDRVAAVSNRTAQVGNGDRLKVLDHARHFVKVQTDKGAIGWIEEKAVATPEVADEFDALKEEHKNDPAVASAVVRDTVYLHVKPGRDAEKFYLLAEGEKLKMLKRATLVKAVTQMTAAKAQKAIPQASGTNAARKGGVAEIVAAEAPAPPAMEDWWLVTDSQGHTGWIFSRMIDVDAPDSLTRYSEGQRFVGAYILTTVHDEGAPTDQKDIPEYVTVSSPYKAGLPYDFDQVRVFTWSMTHHRYETAFRDKNIEGYLPVTIGKMKDAYGKTPIAAMELPSYSYKVLSADAPAVVPDVATGAMVPGKTVTKAYRLEGNIVRRMGAPGSTAGEQLARPVAEDEKKGKKKRR